MARFCVISYVHNEPFHFPMWMAHYAQIFNPADIYVINNNCSDKSFELVQNQYGFQEIQFKTQFNHDFFLLQGFLQQKLQDLLQKYDGVYVAEADELLFHAKGLLWAGDFYMSIPVDAIRCIGYEPVHDYFGGESSIVEDQPILRQRRLWRDYNYMRKAVFLKKPINYFEHMHTFDESYSICDYQLMLIHTKLIDYKRLFIRNQKTLSEGNFAPRTLETNFGWQNRVANQKDFDKFFKDAVRQSVEIPARYKTLF